MYVCYLVLYQIKKIMHNVTISDAFAVSLLLDFQSVNGEIHVIL
jgi:hypothetical protein